MDRYFYCAVVDGFLFCCCEVLMKFSRSQVRTCAFYTGVYGISTEFLIVYTWYVFGVEAKHFLGGQANHVFFF